MDRNRKLWCFIICNFTAQKYTDFLNTSSKTNSRIHLNCSSYFGNRHNEDKASFNTTRANFRLCMIKYFVKTALIATTFIYIDALLQLLVKGNVYYLEIKARLSEYLR